MKQALSELDLSSDGGKTADNGKSVASGDSQKSKAEPSRAKSPEPKPPSWADMTDRVDGLSSGKAPASA